jgi:uncharacterized protein YdhG (YjbR/CyaY superfamily)
MGDEGGRTPIDDYIDRLPEDRQEAMRQLRDAVRSAAPEAVETIAYKMPAFRLRDGRFLVSFDAYKRHYSLFPWTDAMTAELGVELQPYLAGKGTTRFPADQPIPVDLVRRMVELRVRELEGGTHAGDRSEGA